VGITTRVGLERGARWVFASAVDWPGWCRRGRGDEAALEELLAYADRYAAVIGAGDFRPGAVEVIGAVPGDATTDFGAPQAVGPWDGEPLSAAEAERQVALVVAAWEAFDQVVAGAPAELRKGPRGGGRDRDAVVDHVCEAERSYARKVGVRVPPRTPWAEQRRLEAEAWLALARARPAAGEGAGGTAPAWLLRYSIRRTAWHVTDHLWEVQDRSS
jgi:hypothetical protein